MSTSETPFAERRLLLGVDAPSLLHRNHHARAGTALRDRGGRPAWALHGMLLQILEVIERFAPTAVVFGLDDRLHSVRAETYTDYKAGRAPKDADLVDQLDRSAAMLDALGLRTVTPPGLEADDVSASAAAWAEREGWSCLLVTSDRDSFAHISHHTRVLRLINGGLAASPVLNLDAHCEEEGLRRVGAGLLKRLTAPGARERYEFNLAIMSGRTDIDLGLTPDLLRSPGLLPLDAERVSRVVGHLGVDATTQLALRVLAGPAVDARPEAPGRLSGAGRRDRSGTPPGGQEP